MDIAESNPPDTPDVTILALSGRLDAASADAFAQRMTDGIARGSRAYVLDLAGLDYVNSVGLRSLVGGAKLLAAQHGRLVLCHVQPRVMHILETAGLTSILRIEPTAIEAIAWATAGGRA